MRNGQTRNRRKKNRSTRHQLVQTRREQTSPDVKTPTPHRKHFHSWNKWINFNRFCSLTATHTMNTIILTHSVGGTWRKGIWKIHFFISDFAQTPERRKRKKKKRNKKHRKSQRKRNCAKWRKEYDVFLTFRINIFRLRTIVGWVRIVLFIGPRALFDFDLFSNRFWSMDQIVR